MNGVPAGFYDDHDEALDALEREGIETEPPLTESERAIDPWSSLAIEAPSAWYTEAPAKRSWLLRDVRHPHRRGVFPLGKVGQLIAEGGAGKTMALCQLAVAVATGGTWLGAFSVASSGRVLMILGEEDSEEARRRLHRAARASDATPDPGAIVVLPLAGVAAPMLTLDSDGNLADAPFLDWLRGRVNVDAFRLVVIDPLSRFAGPEAETDNASATRFIQSLESLAAPDRGILNAHHTNKISRRGGRLDATAGRGSSAFVDGARWQCALSVERLKFDGAEEQDRLASIVTFAVTKSNYAATPDEVTLRHDSSNGGALVVVDDPSDLEKIEAARGTSAEREQRKDQKESADVARRDAQRMRLECVALRVAIHRPGLNSTDFREAVRKESGCSGDAANSAARTVRSFLIILPGKNRGELHHPPASAAVLPSHLAAELSNPQPLRS